MSVSWQSETPPDQVHLRPLNWVFIIARAPVLAVLVFSGLLATLVLRIIERPLAGETRPITPFITQLVCRNALRIIGFQFTIKGQGFVGPGAYVANHSTWLDIFVLNATKRLYFVSKSEVSKWPGIGWLARATGTVFIERNRSKAREHSALFEERLKSGHRLLFFPEGTSTDGCRVLPFKTTLFAPFFRETLKETLSVQPVSVIYHAPKGRPDRFYGWWADMDFGPNLLKILGEPHQGCVEVIYHQPLLVRDYKDRKALAKAAEDCVRDGFTSGQVL
ncbi:lyso-ornithine lipid acyltransferase [Epibacterium ulvae]|uniref:Lyso-ornithine lipid acyltransferase n=1 Tax=Epibacterium ulvae TaxID=1156985 RepID=A0A1G5Q8C3_9RHOB|nr:lysophospholipid acyltransferase family protein [Epibacterium ulvae]SCZ57902.1 lyso-ornithine lipid acyltransferase [Epibacterium ulvae]